MRHSIATLSAPLKEILHTDGCYSAYMYRIWISLRKNLQCTDCKFTLCENEKSAHNETILSTTLRFRFCCANDGLVFSLRMIDDNTVRFYRLWCLSHHLIEMNRRFEFYVFRSFSNFRCPYRSNHNAV